MAIAADRFPESWIQLPRSVVEYSTNPIVNEDLVYNREVSEALGLTPAQEKRVVDAIRRVFDNAEFDNVSSKIAPAERSGEPAVVEVSLNPMSDSQKAGLLAGIEVQLETILAPSHVRLFKELMAMAIEKEFSSGDPGADSL